jgi:ammonium transporter, Amt family
LPLFLACKTRFAAREQAHFRKGQSDMNGADTAWIIVATALVLFMTLPGLALFYGGLVRARNVLSVFLHCYAIACVMSILWLALGYSIAFGPGESGL